MKQAEVRAAYTRFPVVSIGAEYLVMGHLMRRNILTYKAPPNNEGYDLICIHPDPRRRRPRQIRVQVKSRLATDHGSGFPVKEKTISAFDFLIVAYMNVGYFFGRRLRLGCKAGRREPVFYTLPAAFIRRHLDTSSSWEKVNMGGLKVDRYKNEIGFEQIAVALGIPYPAKAAPSELRTTSLHVKSD